MIAFANVLRGIPPEQLNGRKIDMAPLLEYAAGTVFGPRLAPKIIIDQRHMMTVDPIQENITLALNFPAQVHPMDDDQTHILIHQKGMVETAGTDPHGLFRQHIMAHMAQMQQKAAQAAGVKPGQPAAPGGAQPPRFGAQPGQTRPVLGPPGGVPQDQMQDPSRMPRRAV